MVLITDACSCGASSSSINPDCERCRHVWLINKVDELRIAQTKYFSSRKASDLETARRLEAIVDAGLSKLKKTQIRLFDDETQPK